MKIYRSLYWDFLQPNEILIKIRVDKDTFAELCSVTTLEQAKSASDKILLIHRTIEELTQIGAKVLKDMPKLPSSMVPLQPQARRGPSIVKNRKPVVHGARRKFPDASEMNDDTDETAIEAKKVG